MFQHITAHIFLTVLMYIFIFLSMRIMGKREIGKLSVFDLTISIMIAEIAVFVIEDIERPIYDGFVPMATLVLIQVLVAQISLKSRKLRLLVDGKPSILISDGKLHRGEMRKQRYNIDDLLLQLRGQNIDSPADVEFAILETSGQLTVIEKNKGVSSSNQTGNSSSSAEQKEQNSGGQESSGGSDKSDKSDSSGKVKLPKHKIRYEGLPIPLIMDGKVQDDNLEMIGKNRFWLRTQIRQKGVSDFRDVFLCSIDHKGQIYIDPIGSR
ncbi:YetF domain-containing protein [Paenibacillus sp. FSL R10-2736]|uniref:YetF domain-containing protein n=1 Tax=Paenibacillus sp. FSL R10-2736 TaxID=2954692 RepID=UPI004046D809